MELIQTLRETVSGDDRGVSPVIGVILMVAITVILAAVIATFVLGLGEQVSSTAPQANFDVEIEGSGSDQELAVEHTGGQDIDRSDINLNLDGSQIYDGSESDFAGRVVSNDFTDTGDSEDFSTEIVAGDRIILEENGDKLDAESDLSILFIPQDGSTATLAERTVEFN